jgi:hypothetical protein
MEIPYIGLMKQIIPSATVLALCAAPVLAEDKPDEGLSLMEEGAKLFFQGILQEMEPAMDDLKAFADTMEPAMRQFVREMGPALAEVLKKVDDLTLYHPPEMLPNGDIIMRRKDPKAPIETPLPDNPEIEL